MCWWRWRRGLLWSFNWQTGAEAKAKQGFVGSFIHLSLSSYDKGQALTKAQVRSGSVTSSWPVSPSRPLVWRLPSVYQPAENLSTEKGGLTDTEHEKLFIQGKLGWLHRIGTYKRVMSLVLMYVNQEKRMSRRIQLLNLNNILYNHFSGEDFFFLPQTTNHLPDPAYENSFRLNIINLILRQNDNNITRMNCCTI